ncbi:hypothetical protein BgAZ_207130 [Babesia gibsoni]|uniref:Cyclin N-terminal domain-containing protein n=1 Tax=Babesia gibsoni TaxID=33632 RepID=A0AAD8PEG2_BABGI|nr:hypothetical protein BgAZ_207130 [Babesia gibsoni]
MPRSKSAIGDYTFREFQELLAELRFTSLKTANISTNVALAFLTGIPHTTRNAELALAAPGAPYAAHERVYTQREGGILEHDHYIELEDDRHERQIAADEAELEKTIVALRFNEKADEDESVGIIRAKFRQWFTRFSVSTQRYRKMKSEKLADMDIIGTAGTDGDVKPKKFYISYAELIIPSQDVYNPDFLHVPLHYALLKYKLASKGSVGLGVTAALDDSIGDNIIGAEVDQDLSSIWEVNTKFRLSNEWLHPTLSLTKLSRIKLMLFLAPMNVPHLDPSTVFSAWVLFERLVIKGSVTKANRKLFAATCLILAYKFNQDGEQVVINDILAYLSRERSITPQAIFANEMKVFTLLEFSLKQSYSGMRKHVDHYLELHRTTFMDLYETSESTYLDLET